MADAKLYDDGRRNTCEDVTANNTVAAADSGMVLNIKADGLVTTLPDAAAGLAGLTVIVRLAGVPVTNGPAGTGANESVGHSISPHSSDAIDGLGAAGVDNKDLVMVKASMIVGDYVKLVCNGVDTWYVVEASGAWTREA